MKLTRALNYGMLHILTHILPRPHQQQMSKQRSTLLKQHSTLLPKMATLSNEFIVKFRPFDKNERNWTCCRNDEISFDIVAKTGNIVAEIGNIVAKTATMSKPHLTLSNATKHSTMLLRYCCWCEQGFSDFVDSQEKSRAFFLQRQLQPGTNAICSKSTYWHQTVLEVSRADLMTFHSTYRQRGNSHGGVSAG